MRSAIQRIILMPHNLTGLSVRWFSSTLSLKAKYSCKLLVVGGGSGGCSIAAKFAPKMGRKKLIVIEPSEIHYYQPMFTLVGGGMKTLKECSHRMEDVLPKRALWIKDSVTEFEPSHNRVRTKEGHEVKYDFMVVALGIQLNYNKVEGLQEALKSTEVCSNYSPLYVTKTFEALQHFKNGNAVFTFPNTPIKCAGAPQKIAYIADHYFRKTGKRSEVKIIYNTSLGVLFGVKKYADALWKVCGDRDITVNLRHDLIAIKPKSKEAVFQNLDDPLDTKVYKYGFLHVTPPMSSPDVLKRCTELVDQSGFLNIDKGTLQHLQFPTIFGVGDCTNAPTSKTAAAVAAQVGIVRQNLSDVMQGSMPEAQYDGYTSCPLLTGYDKCILAEFDYNTEPLETFPIDQSKERRSMFYMKKEFMPNLYWNAMLRGYWEGPGLVRKVLHFGVGK